MISSVKLASSGYDVLSRTKIVLFYDPEVYDESQINIRPAASLAIPLKMVYYHQSQTA